MKRLVVALVLGGLLLAGACSSSKSSAPPTTAAPFWKTTPTVDMRGKATGTPPSVHVQVGDNTFTPEVLRIDPGVTVVFTNSGAVTHNILKTIGTQDFGAQFGVDSLAPGGQYSFLFKTAGAYQYTCTLHTGMVGLVAVGSAPLPT